MMFNVLIIFEDFVYNKFLLKDGKYKMNIHKYKLSVQVV